MSEDRVAWALELRDRLTALPTHQSDAVGLLYFRRMRYPEIAVRLGLTLAEVRTAIAGGMLGLGAPTAAQS